MLAGSFGLDEHTSVIPNVLFMFTEQTWSPQKKKTEIRMRSASCFCN